MSPKLRVWHLVENYPPDYGGGATITTQEICRYLAKRGHEIRILCVENAPRRPYTVSTDHDGSIRVDRVNLPYFKTQDPEGWHLGFHRWREHERRIDSLMGQLLGQWKPHLVDYHAVRPLGEVCVLSLVRHGLPLVATLHDAWLVCPQVMLLRSPTIQPCPGPAPLRCLECVYSSYDGTHKRAMLKLPWRLVKLGIFPAYRLYRRAAARKHVSGAMARSTFIARLHQPHMPEPVRSIPLGIDLTGLPAQRPPRPRTPLRFGFMAGFQPTKGIWHVLDAADALKQRGLGFEVHIWGLHQDRGYAEIAARGLADRVFLRGMYGCEQRWHVYNQIDVALMATTVCEPLGRVPMEAAAVGVPTIAPAVGGIPETIRDGVDGLLYRFRDPQDLERQMRRVVEEAGLVERLIINLQPVLDVRQRVSAVEAFYCRVLGLTSALPLESYHDPYIPGFALTPEAQAGGRTL